MGKKKKIIIMIVAAVLLLSVVVVLCMSCNRGCKHELTMIDAVEATCTEDGHDAYYLCEACGKLYLDENATEEITEADVLWESAGHDMKYYKAVNPTFTKEGRKKYWECSNCGLCFSDALGRNEVTEMDLIIAVLDGNLVSGDGDAVSGEFDVTLLKTGSLQLVEAIEGATKTVVVGNKNLTKVYRDGAEISFSANASDEEAYEIVSVVYNGVELQENKGVYQIIYDADNPTIYIKVVEKQSDTTIILPAIDTLD